MDTSLTKVRDTVASSDMKPSPLEVSVSILPSASALTHKPRYRSNSSELVSFAHAMTAFLLFLFGLSFMAFGTIVASVWLTVTGFLLTSAGGLLHGWTLSDPGQQ